VPDEQLQQASQILVDHKFPLLHDPPRVEFGYWDTGCLRHGLDGSGWMRVHLLPLLLVGFTLEETIEVPSLFNPKVQIRTPLPLRYMLLLINHLKKLPMGDSSRNRVRKDLYSFMAYDILPITPEEALCSIPDPSKPLETEERYQERVRVGMEFMRAWDWGHIEQDDLALVESLVLDCRKDYELTEVVQEHDDSDCEQPDSTLWPPSPSQLNHSC
jgi:hypothetical protein